jgi:hypothetical protein
MDLENLSRQSVPKGEIALRIEATRREREEASRRRSEIRSRRRVVVVLILALSATVGATATYYWSHWFPGPQPTQVHSKCPPFFPKSIGARCAGALEQPCSPGARDPARCHQVAFKMLAIELDAPLCYNPYRRNFHSLDTGRRVSQE